METTAAPRERGGKSADPPAPQPVSKKGGTEAQRRFEKLYDAKTGTTKSHRSKESFKPGTDSFEVCRKSYQPWILFQTAHEKQNIRSTDGKARFRAIFCGSKAECERKFKEIAANEAPVPVWMQMMPTCLPFPICKDAYKDVRDPKTLKVIKRDEEGRKRAAEKGDRNIREQKVRRGKAKEEQRRNAQMRKMGKAYKNARQVLEEQEQEMREDDEDVIDGEFLQRPLDTTAEEEAELVKVGEEEDFDNSAAPAPAPAPAKKKTKETKKKEHASTAVQESKSPEPAADAKADVPKIRREHETRGQQRLLFAVFTDFEARDAQEKIVDQWRIRRDTEYERRLSVIYQEKRKEKGIKEEDLVAPHEHRAFKKWLDANVPPWKARWDSTMHELFEEACDWWRTHHWNKAARLPAGWKCPRPPKSHDIQQIFATMHEATAQKRAAGDIQKLIQIRKQLPQPPKRRDTLVIWWLRLKWAETHPQQSHEAVDKSVDELNQWWFNHNQAKAVVPPKGYVCPPFPEPEELLDGSKHEPEYEDAEEASEPPEWVNWIADNPKPTSAFDEELENDPRAEDDTELQAWCRSRDLALAQCKWELIEEPMPSRKDTIKDWLAIPENHPPDIDDPKVIQQEEPVVVPLFATETDEDAKRWLNDVGSKLSCLRDVNVGCIHMYEFVNPTQIEDDSIPQIYRDEEENNIMQGRKLQKQARAELETEKRLMGDTIKTINVYDNAVVTREKLPEGLSKEDYAIIKKQREEMASKHEEYKCRAEAIAKKRAELEEIFDEAATARTGKTGQTLRKAREASGNKMKLIKDWKRRGVPEAERREQLDELDREMKELDAEFGLRSQTLAPTDLPIPDEGLSGFDDLSRYALDSSVPQEETDDGAAST